MRKAILVAAVVTSIGLAVSTYMTLGRAKGKIADMMCHEDSPLQCDLAAMTPAQRTDYDTQKTRLKAAVREIKEMPDGYAFRFASEPDLLVAAAKFVEGERKCCPFYTFTLTVEPNKRGMWIRITGPGQTKDFIKDAITS